MFQSHVVGRPFGVELRMHGTVGLMALAFAGVSLVTGGLGAALGVLGTLALVFGSVALHELGHVFAARAFGIGTTGVTLFPFGGVASLTREARSGREEVAVALAGPAVNVALAALFALGVVLLAPFEAVAGALAHALWINVALAAFNLLPAWPMDGGRVLRGALWSRWGRGRATRAAARTGQVLAVGMGLVGLVANPMLLVIAAVVWFAATGELARTPAAGAPWSAPVTPDAPWGAATAPDAPWSGPVTPAAPWWARRPARGEVPEPVVAVRPRRWGSQAPTVRLAELEEPAAPPPRLRVVTYRTPWGVVTRLEAA